MDYYSATKKWNIATYSNMDRPREYSERQIPYDTTYMWNLKNNTNESTFKTEIDSQT